MRCASSERGALPNPGDTLVRRAVRLGAATFLIAALATTPGARATPQHASAAVGQQPAAAGPQPAVALHARATVAQQAPPPKRPRQQQKRQEERQLPDDAAAMLARGGAFTAAVEMVRVPVIVVDDDGAFVEHLEQAAFAVRDGGRRHAVDHFVSEVEPVSVGILVDASAAMQPYEAGVRGAVEHIARTLRPDDELFLIAYGPSAKMLQAPTRSKDAIVAALGGYAVQEGADRALYDAIETGLDALARSRFDKRSLIVIGTGGDTAGGSGELAVQQSIHRTGVTVHAIALAPPDTGSIGATPAARVNRLQTLPEIAHFTGGLLARRPVLTSRYGGTADWLAAAGSSITNYVKHQYLLHYVPQTPPRPGTWREIRIEVRGGYHEVRARSGYVR